MIGYGTGGTVTGVASILREKSPHTQIILSEPNVAALIASGIPQKRNKADEHGQQTPSESHPSWEPHPIQGWTPDFIPQILQVSLEEL